MTQSEQIEFAMRRDKAALALEVLKVPRQAKQHCQVEDDLLVRAMRYLTDYLVEDEE